MFPAAALGKQVGVKLMGMYDIDASYTVSGYPEIKVTKSGYDMYQLNIVPDDLSVYTWGSKNFNPTNLFNVSDLNEPYKVDQLSLLKSFYQQDS